MGFRRQRPQGRATFEVRLRLTTEHPRGVLKSKDFWWRTLVGAGELDLAEALETVDLETITKDATPRPATDFDRGVMRTKKKEDRDAAEE